MSLYIFFAALALICAVVIIFTLRPVRKGECPPRFFRLLLFIGFPVISIGLYLLLGTPVQPGAPAAYENSGPRYEWRLLVTKEYELMREMSEYKKAPPLRLFMELTRLRLARGEVDLARQALVQAQIIYPEAEKLKQALERMDAFNQE